MQVLIESLLKKRCAATGIVAVIDVFRAFTTAAVALANGASRIIMVGTVDEALALRNAGIGQICVGEVRGRAPEGFDFGNSPFEVSSVDFSGKTIIQRTPALVPKGRAFGDRIRAFFASLGVTAILQRQDAVS